MREKVEVDLKVEDRKDEREVNDEREVKEEREMDALRSIVHLTDFPQST